MRIEVFTESRDPHRPDANEDCLVVLPGRGLAVIDGVTDRSGARFDGMTSGRIASRVVAKAVAAFLIDPAEQDADPARLVDAVCTALRSAYSVFGLLDLARTDPGRRFGATLALAIERKDTWRFLRIGDSGIRIDGQQLLVDETRVDRVTSALRAVVYDHLTAAGADKSTRARVAHVCVLNGLAAVHPDMHPWLDGASCRALRAASIDAAGSRVPEASRSDIEALVDGGVIKGQSRFSNVEHVPFGYGVLDGFGVPPAFVHCEDRPRAGLRSIELFTDGYFKVPQDASLAGWEAAFEQVEREDPEKLHSYPAPKGSIGDVRADDRTVIVATV